MWPWKRKPKYEYMQRWFIKFTLGNGQECAATLMNGLFGLVLLSEDGVYRNSMSFETRNEALTFAEEIMKNESMKTFFDRHKWEVASVPARRPVK